MESTFSENANILKQMLFDVDSVANADCVALEVVTPGHSEWKGGRREAGSSGASTSSH